MDLLDCGDAGIDPSVPRRSDPARNSLLLPKTIAGGAGAIREAYFARPEDGRVRKKNRRTVSI